MAELRKKMASATEAGKAAVINGESAVAGSSAYHDPSYKHKTLIRSGESVELADSDLNHSCILVLYLGGTIGMKSHAGLYSPEENYLVKELKKLPMFHDATYSMTRSGNRPTLEEESQIPLCMPLSKEGRRVIYTVFEYSPLLDSANMTFQDYARLATDIKANYESYDGFVVLHGTDTMAYTASAISFMLDRLGKPVIITGSQIPIFETRCDGRDNFLGALILAGHYNIPEVMIYFNNVLLRGNRATKASSSTFDAFRSPNMRPLAELEINIKVDWASVFRPPPGPFTVYTNMCPNVGILRLFPSITVQTVKAFLQPPMEGVVLQSYGAGNGPDARYDLMQAFRQATVAGVLIVNITQCYSGSVGTFYATAKVLKDAGIIPGFDLTPEAALMKLGFILGRPNLSLAERRKLLETNLRGEMSTTQIQPDKTQMLDISLITKLTEALRLSSSEEISHFRDTLYPTLLCAAGRKGDIESLMKLIEMGVDPSLYDYDGRTALHLAVSEGHLNTVKYLIDIGASVHVRDRYGHSPLDDAVRFNRIKIIKVLRDTGAHLALPKSKQGMMLCNNVMHEEVRGLESWRLAGANLNQGDYAKRTALHVAAATNNVAAVEYLLEQNVDLGIKDNSGMTPLQEAENCKNTQIVQLLHKKLKSPVAPK